MCNTIDKLFVNGNFYCKEGKSPIRYIGVKDGRIVSKGNGEEINLDGIASEIVNLGGSSVYPGFIDAHLHLIAYSQKELYEVSLNDVQSKEEMVLKIRKFIKEKNLQKGEWVIGSGWNHEEFDDKELPDRFLLDQISSDHPIFLLRTCYHICVVNSNALKVANIHVDSVSPKGGKIDRDGSGIPTGILRENAMDLLAAVMPKIHDKERIKQLVMKGCMDLAEAGITTVHTDDFSYVEDKETLWACYRELAESDKLPIRVILQLRAATIDDIQDYHRLGLASWQRHNNMVVGPIKIIADGSLGSRTAALDEPYADDKENKGIMLIQPDNLDKMVYESLINDFDICIHAIGDKTMGLVLEIYEKHEEMIRRKECRPSVIHCQIGSKEILEKFQRLNVIANIQPIFLHSDWKIAENRVGKERLDYSYAWKKYIDAGIKCAGSSDAPIESFNPLYGIYSAVTRMDLTEKPPGGWIPEEGLAIKDAIDIFTINAAYLSHEEALKGDFEIGKYADFVILSDDLRRIEENSIKNVRVEKIYIGGNLIHQ
ncbi:MAG: amidohydrolase [Bacillota bacterium]